MNKHLLIYIAIVLSISSVILVDLINKKNDLQPIQEPIKLTNTDTIYLQLDSLQKQQDTIKIYYEKKISNYHILPSSERFRLFSNRINR
jgi:hypothetical protein